MSSTKSLHAPAAITISSDDLFNMRRLADAPVWTRSVAEEREANLRETRHQASKERASRWPNTLEGLRKRKDKDRLDRAAETEAKYKILDAEDAARREAERQAILNKAKDFMEEQKEKIKVVKNYRQKSHDFDILRQQAELKAEMLAEQKKIEEEDYKRMLHDLAQTNAEEEGKIELQRRKAAALQAERKETLRLVIQRRLAEMAETEEAGRRQNAEIIQRQNESTAAAIARKELGAQKNKEFQIENQRLKALREEMKKGEAETLVWIAAQAEAKEVQDKLIKDILLRARVEAEKKAKQISDIMSNDYLSRQNHEDTRLASQVAEADAKNAARAAEKARLQKEMKDSIAADIKRVKDRVLQAIRERMAEDEREDKLFRQKLAEMEDKEREAREKSREIATKYKYEALATVEERKKKAEEARNKAIAEERAVIAKIQSGDDDAGFRAFVDEVRAEEKAKGKSLQPFERLIYKTLNPKTTV
jgi:hypothetical protein